MNNLFDIGRFGKYLKYDLHNFRNNYLFSLVIVGLIPVISYVFFLLGSFFVNRGNFSDFTPWRAMAFFLAYAITVMTAPVKLYGHLTEKKKGSNWLLIPASGFEKFLSLLVVTCVVIPLCLVALLLCSDIVMSLIAPEGYGKFILSYLPNGKLEIGDDISAMTINFPIVAILNWCESILVFTLGAIFFKKGKTGKTILCMFALGLVFGMVLSRIIPSNVCEWSDFLMNGFSDAVNTYSCVSYTIIFILLLTGLYYRIRTLKH